MQTAAPPPSPAGAGAGAVCVCLMVVSGGILQAWGHEHIRW
ncbi:MAG: hypothetical protein ACLUIX_03905 [Oscillospiraceae bacterium]